MQTPTLSATVKSGEDSGDTLTFRPLPLDKVKSLQAGTRVKVFSAYGKHGAGIVNVKVNGRPKTWKTRPDDVSVPIKYGLYEYATIEYKNGAMSDTSLYFIEVTED